MMGRTPKKVLECQDCGEVVRDDLSPSEVQKMAERPYDFIVYCYRCTVGRERDDHEAGWR